MLWIVLLMSIATCRGRKGFVDEFLIDTTSECGKSNEIVYNVNSEMQCVQKCLRQDNCHTINYKIGPDLRTLESKCKLLTTLHYQYSGSDVLCKKVFSKGWKSIMFKRIPDDSEALPKSEDSLKPFSSTALGDIRPLTILETPSKPTQSNDVLSVKSNASLHTYGSLITPITMQHNTSIFDSALLPIPFQKAVDVSSLTNHAENSRSSSYARYSGVQSSSNVSPATVILISSMASTALPSTESFSGLQPTLSETGPSISTTVPTDSFLAAATSNGLKTGTNIVSYSTLSALSSGTSMQSALYATPVLTQSLIDPSSNSPVLNSSYQAEASSNFESYASSSIIGTTPMAGNVPSNVFSSCDEVLSDHSSAQSGVYELTIGQHYCMMGSMLGCSEGGWTLAMKIDGTKNTFRSGSTHWHVNDLYNEINGVNSLGLEEAKFPAFNVLNFNDLCIGMNYSGETSWIQIPYAATSLLSIFQPGTFIATNIGRNVWKSLLSGSSLQANCNREGFNVYKDGGSMFARIGIVGNDANDCIGLNSYIGFGTKLTINKMCNFAGSVFEVSCGNLAFCSSDNGDKRVATFGYILVK